MKYELLLKKVEYKTVEAFSDTPQNAVAITEENGFKATHIKELLDENKDGAEFEVTGRCEGCGAALINHQCKTDSEGVPLCCNCFEGMLSHA